MRHTEKETRCGSRLQNEMSGSLGVFPRVRAYAPAADARSPDGFAGASKIRATPMITSPATALSRPPRFARNVDCQHGHNRAVSEARPCCEGDQAAIRRWITYCHQQENA